MEFLLVKSSRDVCSLDCENFFSFLHLLFKYEKNGATVKNLVKEISVLYFQFCLKAWGLFQPAERDKLKQKNLNKLNDSSKLYWHEIYGITLHHLLNRLNHNCRVRFEKKTIETHKIILWKFIFSISTKLLSLHCSTTIHAIDTFNDVRHLFDMTMKLNINPHDDFLVIEAAYRIYRI